MTASQQQPVYLDPGKPLDDRVNDLLRQLTLAEKISLLGTTAPAIERLKVPAMNGWNQSLHGIVWTEPTTMFPVPISMAATWNTTLVHDVAAAIADEGRAINNYWPTVQGKTEPTGGQGQDVTVTADGKRLRHNGLVYRSPVINISRDPRWGRVWEAFGEDTWLTSRMTVAYVKGTQGDDPKYLKLAATLKHYAVNNEERDRTKIDVTVSERMLREYFLPHFKAGIVEGKAHVDHVVRTTRSTARPAPNTSSCCKTLLRDEWKFEGFIVPDSGAVERLVTGHHKYATFEEAAARTVLVGSDLDNSAYVRYLPGAVAKGLLTERHIDQALRRVLKVRFRLGEFDPPGMVPYTKLGKDEIDSPAHRQLALRAARESIVLLSEPGQLPAARREHHQDDRRDRSVCRLRPDRSELHRPVFDVRQAARRHPEEGRSGDEGALRARQRHPGERQSGSQLRRGGRRWRSRPTSAVLFVGINEILEREGIDRNFINLPPVQTQLIRRVLDANPTDRDRAPERRPVVARRWRWPRRLPSGPTPRPFSTCSGRVRKAGPRSPTCCSATTTPAAGCPYTVYQSVQDIPPMKEYDITQGVHLHVLRRRSRLGLRPRPELHDLRLLEPQDLGQHSRRPARGDVRRSQQRQAAGDEVVQLYVRDVEASVKRPKKQLMAFERISLGRETRAPSASRCRRNGWRSGTRSRRRGWWSRAGSR